MIQRSKIHPFFLAELVGHTGLLRALVRHDFAARYKGSIGGFVWSLAVPVAILAMYTWVFKLVFDVRWPENTNTSQADFAAILFAGILVFNLFAEVVNRAPTLITSATSYVKKIQFPLEILIWVSVFSALLHFIISISILLIFLIALGRYPDFKLILVPLIIVPLLLKLVGIGYLLASFGVFFRDLGQGIVVVTNAALFLAPVFYPSENLSFWFRKFVECNPITLPVIQIREVLIWDKMIDWIDWGWSFVAGLVIAQIGYLCFMKLRSRFADVL